MTGVGLSASVGSLELVNPVMTASGTVGHSTELAGFLDLSALGAVVVKSLAAFRWEGNPAPRLAMTPAGMLNSVGLQGPGVAAWVEDELPALAATGATIVASIWGRSVEEFEAAALALEDTGPEVVAVEVNLSCPNLHGGSGLFAQSAQLSAEVIRAVDSKTRPTWAKLTAAVADVRPIAEAAVAAGAEALTLVNTLPGMVIDVQSRRPLLGARYGGLSGPAIHPVAVRTVFDVHAAMPEVSVIGVGGVSDAVTALEMLMAGASAVQVGTASFRDPRACSRLITELTRWCADHGVREVAELIGAAHE